MAVLNKSGTSDSDKLNKSAVSYHQNFTPHTKCTIGNTETGGTDLTNFIIKEGVEKNVAKSDGLPVENNVQIHISPLNYMCERCGDKFETNYKLTRHKITHETNHYKCGECDFVTIRLGPRYSVYIVLS